MAEQWGKEGVKNLNTSHVKVYRLRNWQKCRKKKYLNTSHVKVYRQAL